MASGNLHRAAFRDYMPCINMLGMSKPVKAPPPYPNFIRQWRKFRDGMTQQQLLEGVEKISKSAIGTAASLSRIESGYQNTTLETLAAIAQVLDADIGKIMSLNPLESRDVPILGRRASEQRERILAKVAEILDEGEIKGAS